jgi:hypothetical protein
LARCSGLFRRECKLICIITDNLLQCQELQSNCQIDWKEYKQVPFQIIGYNGVLYDVRAYTVTVLYNHSTRTSYQKSLFRYMAKLHWRLFYQIITIQLRHMQEKAIFISCPVITTGLHVIEAYVYVYIQCSIHIYEKQYLCKVIQILQTDIDQNCTFHK